ncbi:hypothetical protein J6590_101169 [Homalodisca vitripennis]|nr:hypothetical protein J6590_101169 [Homalodisca vitripennis]
MSKAKVTCLFNYCLCGTRVGCMKLTYILLINSVVYLSVVINVRIKGADFNPDVPISADEFCENFAALQHWVGQDRSAVTHPSSSHVRRCLIRLSYYNLCSCYTAQLAIERDLVQCEILGGKKFTIH